MRWDLCVQMFITSLLQYCSFLQFFVKSCGLVQSLHHYNSADGHDGCVWKVKSLMCWNNLCGGAEVCRKILKCSGRDGESYR